MVSAIEAMMLKRQPELRKRMGIARRVAEDMPGIFVM